MTFPDEHDETVIPATTDRYGRACEIRLYPMVIEADGGASSGGPHPADAKRVRLILQRLQARSAAFGTKVAAGGDVGVVRIPS